MVDSANIVGLASGGLYDRVRNPLKSGDAWPLAGTITDEMTPIRKLWNEMAFMGVIISREE